MQAVYELSTVRPFIPEKAKYTLRELEIYGHGYYEALAAALRVMKPAAKRWEGRMRNHERPHLVGGETGGRVAAPAGSDEADRFQPVLFWLIVGTGVIFVLELLGVMAAAIYHLVQ